MVPKVKLAEAYFYIAQVNTFILRVQDLEDPLRCLDTTATHIWVLT